MKEYELAPGTDVMTEEEINGYYYDPDFKLVLSKYELSSLDIFRIALIGVACIGYPTGMISNSRIANEIRAVHYSISEEEINLPEKYNPTNDVEQAAADAWIEAELERQRNELVDELELKDEQNLAISILSIGALANMGAVIPNFFPKKHKPDKFDLIKE